MMKQIILLLFIFRGILLYAQNEVERNAFISEELYEQEWTEQQNEAIIDLNNHPINLNTTTREELESTGILSPQQIENILFYLYAYGDMKTIYELKMVRDLDYITIQKLLPYVFVAPREKENKRYLNQSINISMRGLATLPEGYKSKTDSLVSSSKKYIGDPLYYGIAYQGKYGKDLSWGVALEKDAGERSQPVPDYNSFFLHYQSQQKRLLNQIILGSFKLRFAQGLIMNNTYETGYSSLQRFDSPEQVGLRKHNSFSESGFLRGAAVHLKKSDLNVLLYASFNSIDASVSDSVITSVSQSGKHNTRSSLERRGNESVTSFGGHMNYKYRQFELGMSGVVNTFSKPVSVKSETLANRFYFRGNENIAFSVNWGYKNQLIKLYGEEAYSNNSFSFVNSLILQPTRDFIVSFSQRYYSPRFYSFYGRVYGNGNLRNEEGYYFHTSLYTGMGFYLSANIDYYRNLWAVSQSDFPKDGLDFRLRLENRMLDKWNFVLAFKRSKREKELEDEFTTGYVVSPDYRSSFSLRATCEFSSQLLSQSLIEYAMFENQQRNQGFHLSQIFTWSSLDSQFKIQGILSVFEGEEGVSFYSPLRHSLYSGAGERISGRGQKLQLNFTYKINSALTTNVSYSYLRKENVSNLGSGLETIRGNERQLISFLLRCKF
ncbi:MAG: ComEA family DNA-binding protein [Bacteroidales bacterium]